MLPLVILINKGCPPCSIVEEKDRRFHWFEQKIYFIPFLTPVYFLMRRILVVLGAT